MRRYVRCPDCTRLIREDRMAGHVRWQLKGHPKAKRALRKAHKAAKRREWLAQVEASDGPPVIGWGRKSTPSIRGRLAAHKREQGVQ